MWQESRSPRDPGYGLVIPCSYPRLAFVHFRKGLCGSQYKTQWPELRQRVADNVRRVFQDHKESTTLLPSSSSNSLLAKRCFSSPFYR